MSNPFGRAPPASTSSSSSLPSPSPRLASALPVRIPPPAFSTSYPFPAAPSISPNPAQSPVAQSLLQPAGSFTGSRPSSFKEQPNGVSRSSLAPSPTPGQLAGIATATAPAGASSSSPVPSPSSLIVQIPSSGSTISVFPGRASNTPLPNAALISASMSSLYSASSSSLPSSSLTLSMKASEWRDMESSAIRKAIDESKSLFRTPDLLARVSHFRLEWLRKKKSMESQLSSAVTTQVEETRLGLELLGKSVDIIKNFRENFRQIDRKARETKARLHEHSLVAKINAGRKNLETTINMLDKFRSIPEQSEILLEDLDLDDGLVKDVYKRLRRLIKLRDEADQSEDKAYTENEKLKKSFDKHLQNVADVLETRIAENIQDAFVIDPPVLVRTMEVVEMEDRALRKVFGKESIKLGAIRRRQQQFIREREKEKVKDMKNDDLEDFTNHRMRDLVLQTISKSVANTFLPLEKEDPESKGKDKKKEKEKEKEKDEQKQKERNDGGDDEETIALEDLADGADKVKEKDKGKKEEKVDMASKSEFLIGVLDELKEIIEEDLLQVHSVVAPCFPPAYKITTYYETLYRRAIRRTLERHCQRKEFLSKKALLKTVVWVQWYEEKMKELARKKLEAWKEKRTEEKETVERLKKRNQQTALQQFEQQREAWRKDENEEIEGAIHQIRNYKEHELRRLCKELVVLYNEGAQQTMTKLITAMLRHEVHESAEEEDENRHLVTPSPADLFYTINQQFELVLQAFPLFGRSLFRCAATICDIIRDVYQDGLRKFIENVDLEGDKILFGDERIEKSERFFIAVINNMKSCEENMSELKDRLVQVFEEEEAAEKDDAKAIDELIAAVDRKSDPTAPEYAPDDVNPLGMPTKLNVSWTAKSKKDTRPLSATNDFPILGCHVAH